MYENFTMEDSERWIEEARKIGIIGEEGGIEKSVGRINEGDNDYEEIYRLIYPRSVQGKGNRTFAILKLEGKRALGIFGIKDKSEEATGKSRKADPMEVFAGNLYSTDKSGTGKLLVCPLTHENAEELRKIFPYTAPSSLSDRSITFGVGDRLGIASPGHLRIFNRYEASPVLAQQSVRELNLTGRNYKDVLDAATWAVFQENYRKPWGADGDHLKTEDWVETALSIGFTMLTADVSDYIHGEYKDMAPGEMEKAYKQLDDAYRKEIEKRYLGHSFEISKSLTLTFQREELERIALIYHEAIDHASLLYERAMKTKGKGKFDFELSIDETETPTTPHAHYFIADQVLLKGVEISSMAPRFVGEFQKAIDYIGDPEKFETSFREHVDIAKHFGYRISVHSGSDKFKVFPIIGRITGGRFHIKTAGTNWLEALRVIARTEPELFRKIFDFAKKSYKKAREYYHVTPNLGNLPDIKLLADGQLPNILENPDARQVLHITYGEMLKDGELNGEIYRSLYNHIEEYWDELERHIGRHLKSLHVPVKT